MSQYSENSFLEDSINGKKFSIYLLNGVRLEGRIVKHGDNAVVLEQNDITQLVYKHAIASIIPSRG